jgi:uncharacterized membrane protein
MDPLSLIRIIFGSVFVLFIPGFSWTYLFFDRDEIDAIERIALSFGLSIALVPLSVFYLNYLFGVRITLINCAIVISVLTLVPVGWLRLKRHRAATLTNLT